MKDAKPREFWIYKPVVDSRDPNTKNNDDANTWQVHDYDSQNENMYGHARHGYIHVVEHSDLAAALAELTQLKSELSALMVELDRWKRNAQKKANYINELLDRILELEAALKFCEGYVEAAAKQRGLTAGDEVDAARYMREKRRALAGKKDGEK